MAPPPSAKRCTVAIIGLGNIGGVAAGCLRAADRHEIVVCVRQPIERLYLERPEGDVEVSLRALTEPAEASPVDLVLLCTKAQQTPSAAPWLARLCDSSTRIAVLQNGISHVERVAPLAGGAVVVPTLVYYNGERRGADRVRLRHVSEHALVATEDADGRAFAQLLEGTPLRVLMSREFSTLAWRKLLINAVANPITALTLQRQAVLRREDIKALCIAILDEAVAVACADRGPIVQDRTHHNPAETFAPSPPAGNPKFFWKPFQGGTRDAGAGPPPPSVTRRVPLCKHR